jgi:hypothetical protein
MDLPFTIEQFFDVFRTYNLAVWPAQILLIVLAVVCIVLSIRHSQRSGSIISGILAVLWLWMGLVYHIGYFSKINPAAGAFGLLFIVQGMQFVYYGIVQPGLPFSVSDARSYTAGLVLILYALVVYPVIGMFSGHTYPASPTFGLPCPTTIFTFGMLLLTVAHVPRLLLVIPLIWAIIGMTAAMQLGVYQDLGLPVAGATALVLLWRRDRQQQKSQNAAAANARRHANAGGWPGGAGTR